MTGVSAQSLVASSGRSPFSIAFTNSGESTGASPITCNIGAVPGAGETRDIFVIAHRIFGDLEITACTIGGVAATRLGGAGTGTLVGIAFFVARVPTGTTAEIIPELSDGSTDFIRGVGAYRAINWSGNTTPLDSTVDDTPVAGVLDLSLDTPVGGFVLAGTSVNNGGLSSWTGATLNYDRDLQTGERISGALASGVVAAAPRTVTVENTDTSTTASLGQAISLFA